MSDYKAFASFNQMTITGRLSFAEVVEYQGKTWLSVTLLTELVDEGKTIAVTFNNNNGLLSLFKKGALQNGRRITVTGHLANFTELYFDKKAGKTRVLKRPVLHLSYANVMPGGLGPAAKKDTDTGVVAGTEVELDEAPDYGAESKEQAEAGLEIGF
jgi:hypothetical protein